MSTKFQKYETESGLQFIDDIRAEDIAFLESDKNFIHNQITPSTTWAVTHNLNKKPSVSVLDSAGTLVHGYVNYVSDTQITLEFSFAFAGTAYLN
jgi:hypothetical protein